MMPSALVLIVGSAGLTHAANPAETTREIAAGVYSFVPGDDYRSMFVVTDEGGRGAWPTGGFADQNKKAQSWY